MARPNWLAGIGGLLGGAAQGIDSFRQYQMQQQQLAILKAAAGIRDGDVPTGASVIPDLGATNAPPLPSSLSMPSSLGPLVPSNPDIANSPLLSGASLGSSNPDVANSALLSGANLGAAGVGASGGSSGSDAANALASTTANAASSVTPNASSPLIPALSGPGAGSGPVGLTSLTPASQPDSMLSALRLAAAQYGPTTQAGVIAANRAAQAATPGDAASALTSSALSAGTPTTMAPGTPPPTGTPNVLRAAAARAAAGTMTGAAPSPTGGVSDADVAKARGAINGQLAFNNPTVTSPLTGLPTPRYVSLGHGMVQDQLATDYAQRAKLAQLETDRMLALWGGRNATTLERTDMQQTGANARNVNSVTGANDRNVNSVTGRSSDVQARIDASETTAAANRAQAVDNLIRARTPTDTQRAQLVLNAYDKLRQQAKDPLTGEYSVDPDTIYTQAQAMVRNALAPATPSTRGTGATAPVGSGPASGGPISSAGGFNRFLGKKVIIGTDTLSVGPKTIAAAQNPADPNHAAALQILSGSQ